jgi:hypothetical protein
MGLADSLNMRNASIDGLHKLAQRSHYAVSIWRGIVVHHSCFLRSSRPVFVLLFLFLFLPFVQLLLLVFFLVLFAAFVSHASSSGAIVTRDGESLRLTRCEVQNFATAKRLARQLGND